MSSNVPASSPPPSVSPRLCGSCSRPLAKGPASRVFPGYHARCIERAVDRARAVEAND